MNKEKDHLKQVNMEQDTKQCPLTNAEPTSALSDKKRKSEEIKNSTIGGF